jgi:O-antigen/teichoic acid export membrane protein
MADATPVEKQTDRQTPTTAGKRSSLILLNAVLRAIGDVGSKLATAVLALLVARKAGASEFGVFSFAIAFAGIAVTLGQFGQEVVLIREVARDAGQLDRYYSEVLTSKLLLSVPVLLVALAVAAAAGMPAHTFFVVLLIGFGFIFDYVIGVPFAVFQAYERVGLIPVVLITQRWLTTAVAALALFSGRGVVTVAAIYCTGSFVAALFAAQLMFRKIARPRLQVDVRGALAVTRTAVPVGLGIVAYLVLSRIDTTMLEIFKPASEVGQYGAAYRLLETTAFVAWSVNTAVLPTMSRLSPSSEPPVGFVYERALKLVLAITVPLAVGAAILSGPIVGLLYGAEYHRAGDALLILAPTIMLFPVSSLSCQLFYSQDTRRVVGVTYAAVLVQNVVWNLIMIPRYSLYGAAAGTSLSEILIASTLMLLSRPLYGQLHVLRIIAGPLLGSAAAGAVMALFTPSLGLAVPLSIVCYLLVFLGFERLAFPDDLAVITQFATRLRNPAHAA